MERKNGRTILCKIFLYLGTLLYNHYDMIKANTSADLKAHTRQRKDI